MEIVREGGVLGAVGRAAGGADGGLVGITVSLLEHHVAIAVAVGCAEHAGDQRVGEKRATQFVRFLSVLLRSAGGEQRETLAGEARFGGNGEGFANAASL